MPVKWKRFADWAKKRPALLRLAAQLGRGQGRMRWFDHVNPPTRSRVVPDLSGWEDRELSAVWLGHATILLRIGGMTILTDPVLSHRIGLGFGLMTLGPRRHVAAALTAKQLPPLDLILISHAHFDHLDRQTLSTLPRKTPVVTARHTGDLIRDLGFRQITELQWGEHLEMAGLRVTARQVTHWGARTFFDQHRGFNAYLLEAAGRRVLYAGDTAYHDRFKEIGKVDLAILGIGAYDPYIQAHATPEQAWEMATHVRADFVLPMHHSTFRLSHEPMAEPMNRIVAAAGREANRIAISEVGATWIHPNGFALPVLPGT
ncbi:MAG: MBL fold metallo-hydrolase [Planctomycetota bacterium]|nr:MBL fold metallo-hydrolase [Planctomycetota bacterium]